MYYWYPFIARSQGLGLDDVYLENLKSLFLSTGMATSKSQAIILENHINLPLIAISLDGSTPPK
jgi:hypothetical protein